MAESGRAPLFFSNRVPWGAMVVRATHAPFSESGSSKPTKLEEAMGACAVAVAGEEPCAVAHSSWGSLVAGRTPATSEPQEECAEDQRAQGSAHPTEPARCVALNEVHGVASCADARI